MTEKRMTWQEWIDAPIPKTIVANNEPIDFEVDFTVRETATERARRRWGMTEESEPEVAEM